MKQNVLLPPIKQLKFKIQTNINFKNTAEKRYLTEIVSFIGERVPSETDNMLWVSATESDSIFAQFPGFIVQFDKF